MRLLNRNKRKLYYAQLVEEAPVTEDGMYTGEIDLVYGEKTEYHAIVTVATTATNAYINRRDYGNSETYQLMIVCPKEHPFVATTAVWIDNLDSDVHDYQVIGITRNVNQCFVTVQKINADY